MGELPVSIQYIGGRVLDKSSIVFDSAAKGKYKAGSTREWADCWNTRSLLESSLSCNFVIHMRKGENYASSS
jgi:hypothetical protein